MNIDIYSFSGTGNRPINEDSYDVRKENNRCISVLCDGLGGHDCGEVASRYTAEQMSAGLGKLSAISDASVHALMDAINNKIIELQTKKPQWHGMRTTVAGCVIENDLLTYFNCGDSRFYYFRDGNLLCMSTDHSLSQTSVKMGEITFDEIRTDPDRNKLLKVIGDKSAARVGEVYRPVSVRKGDAFLICSDGFWEYVYEDEACIDLSKSQSSEEWVKYMLVRLMLRMNGDNDNYTVIGGIIG